MRYLRLFTVIAAVVALAGCKEEQPPLNTAVKAYSPSAVPGAGGPGGAGKPAESVSAPKKE